MIKRWLTLFGAAILATATGPNFARQDAAEAPTAEDIPPALRFKMKDIDGKEVNLAQYEGKVLLIVNVASKCGYTPQYEGLEQLHQRFSKKGLAILAFPANEFGRQEPGTNEEIKEFCTSTYDVHFKVFGKVVVKGEDICPLYKLLTDKEKTQNSLGEIKWNFEKFLVDPEGNVVKHYRSKTTPQMLVEDIEALLTKVPDSAKEIGALPRTGMPRPAEGQPRDLPGLSNLVAFHDGLISGSAPDGDVGFATLSNLGVRTIISVDGAAPDAARARARGLRYIHLPIGYNGFDETRKLELARATRDAMVQGPVYIHCHHGRHRSAGAAAAIAVSLGWLTPERAVARMEVSGTAADYRGLFACASNATVIESRLLDAVPSDFPEVARPQGFLKAMVEIDAVTDRLKAIEAADWKTPASHPDLVPIAEAGQLVDLFRFLAAGDRVRGEVPAFAAGLEETHRLAEQLEDLLASGHTRVDTLSAQFNRVNTSCTNCHAAFRD